MDYQPSRYSEKKAKKEKTRILSFWQWVDSISSETADDQHLSLVWKYALGLHPAQSEKMLTLTLAVSEKIEILKKEKKNGNFEVALTLNQKASFKMIGIKNLH